MNFADMTTAVDKKTKGECKSTDKCKEEKVHLPTLQIRCCSSASSP